MTVFLHSKWYDCIITVILLRWHNSWRRYGNDIIGDRAGLAWCAAWIASEVWSNQGVFLAPFGPGYRVLIWQQSLSAMLVR